MRGLVDGQAQYVGDVQAVEGDVQGLLVVAAAVADVARQGQVGQVLDVDGEFAESRSPACG
ncbi:MULTISPECIES: hypothetical protein [Streptomyces]|uniref:hypothetical protein n=1 Tax=Streptomyces TaxID=1883 RepID=UPI00114C9F07|nr:MULTISPECIES: hypothetical protein [unclassified Streptomyces]MDX3484993.1 hypothetical protein [Streptomyces sp. ID05-18]